MSGKTGQGTRVVEPTLVDALATMLGQADESPIVLSGADLVLEDEGKRFTLHTSELIGCGAQGAVVRATDEDGAQFAAKLELPCQTLRDRTARKTVLAFLRSLMRGHPLKERHYLKTHLMPLLAAGSVSDEVPGIGATTFDATVMPLCSNELATRADVSFEEIRDVILPEAACALHILHEHRIVHRDVKPSNLYLIDGTLVLGDFGISSVIEEGRRAAATKIDRRTPGYSPHSSTVQCENDWYALGYTIWTLYNGGVHPHQALIDADDLSSVLAGERPVPFVPRKPEHRTLGMLVEGLTYAHARGRLGYDDVQAWLANPEGFSYHDPSPAHAVTREGYQFEGTLYRDDADLASALGTTWEQGKRHLYTHTLASYFKACGKTDLAVALDDIVEVVPATVHNQDAGLSRAVSLIGDDREAFWWRGQRIALASAGHAIARMSQAEADALIRSGVLSWNAFRLGEAARDLYEALQDAESLAADAPAFARAFAASALSGEAASDRTQASPAGDALAHWEAAPAAFYRMICDEDALLAHVGALAAQCSYRPCASYARLAVKEPARAGVADKACRSRASRLLSLYAALGADKQGLARFAQSWGPYGYTSWCAEHVGLWQANTAVGKKLLKKTAACAGGGRGSDEEGVLDAAAAVDELRRHCAKSPYWTACGLADDDAWVVPVDSDAYFTARLAGTAVPRGWVRAMAQASAAAPADAAWLETAAIGSDDREAARAFAKRARESAEDIARAGAKRAEEAERSSIPMNAAKIAGYVILAVFAAIAWQPLAVVAWRIALDAQQTVPLVAAPSAYSAVAFAAFLAAVAALVVRRAAAIASAGQGKASAARADQAVKKLRDEADAAEAGTSRVRAFAAGTAPGTPPRILSAADELARLEKETGSADAPLLWNVAYWSGAGVCAAAMTLLVANGIVYALPVLLDAPVVSGVFVSVAEALGGSSAYLAIALAAACFGAAAYVARQSRGGVALVLMCAAPALPYLGAAAAFAALVIGIIVFALYCIFSR